MAWWRWYLGGGVAFSVLRVRWLTVPRQPRSRFDSRRPQTKACTLQARSAQRKRTTIKSEVGAYLVPFRSFARPHSLVFVLIFPLLPPFVFVSLVYVLVSFAALPFLSCSFRFTLPSRSPFTLLFMPLTSRSLCRSPLTHAPHIP